jgi:hypothetical protein
MKYKFTVLLALMLCVGAFLFPTSAYASDNDRPPTVTATVESEVLYIEALGGSLGIEAIFVNERRFNFRVDGVLRADLLALKNSEAISIYAVDFMGNVSDVVTVKNPHFEGLSVGQPTSTEGIPVTPSNPFTPAGQASVLDNAESHDEKEFFTFSTPAGNVFFLVVDRQRGSDNVYFLNAVTEGDLIALAEQAGTEIPGSNGGIPVSTTPQTPVDPPDAPQEEQPEPPPAAKGGGNGLMIFMLIAVAIAGGAGYYLKIVRPKQQGGNGDYEDEDEDEEDIGDELEFENESEVAEDDRDEDYYNTDEEEPKVEDDGL